MKATKIAIIMIDHAHLKALFAVPHDSTCCKEREEETHEVQSDNVTDFELLSLTTVRKNTTSKYDLRLDLSSLSKKRTSFYLCVSHTKIMIKRNDVHGSTKNFST